MASIRTNMSNDGDHTCPLCAEEMDITDQQLKPCKCGYDVFISTTLLCYQ
jgi:CCR4-NOT transcription complex subunit 4